ncbi:MAG: helix-turn-helix domain-containing protein [Planctomycetes bacterium]|nr:helix-turn-helix domain-containing protein [Planctomycetota bacterium]
MPHSEQHLIETSQGVMKLLEKSIGESIVLGVLRDSLAPPQGEIITAIDGSSGLSYHFKVGFRFSIHTSALGKVVLAFLPEDERAALVKRIPLTPLTPNTICSENDFLVELKETYRKGYGVDVSEAIEGCHCIGVPILNAEKRPIAGLWTSAVKTQIPVSSFEGIAVQLKEGAKQIEAALNQQEVIRHPNRDHIKGVVVKLAKIIEDRLEEELDLHEIAQSMNISYSWFRKVFKEEYGVSPNQFLINCRMEKARELLSTGDLAIKDIGEQLCFSNQYYFSTLFKKKHQISPEGFRKKHKDSAANN